VSIHYKSCGLKSDKLIAIACKTPFIHISRASWTHLYSAALVNNQLRVVQASLVGSILVNLLLILGTAIITGSFWYREQRHDIDDAQVLACLLCLSVFSLMIPVSLSLSSRSRNLRSHMIQTAFYHSFGDPKAADAAVLKLSRASALTLLIIYILYLIFQLRAPALATESESSGESGTRSSVRSYGRRSQENRSATPSLSRIIKFADEESGQPDPGVLQDLEGTVELESIDDQDALEGPNDSDQEDQYTSRSRNTAPRARTSIYTPHGPRRSSVTRHSPHRLLSQDGTHPLGSRRNSFMGSTSSLPLLLGRSRSSFDYSYNHTSCSVNPELVGRTASVVLLVLSSLLVAVCAEFLVNTIDVMVIHSGLSEALIGLIILPIAGNCAEHITAVTVASKNKLDLAIGVSVGSSIQIALFVSPLVVVLGWLLDRDMNFHFSLFETVTLVASTFLVNFLLLNGKTNFLEGSLLCACYFIIGSVYSLRYLRTC
jgi:Ca2+:H+ antiporter